MVRNVWVDENNDADFAKLAANGITGAYFALRDARVTKAYLQGVRAHAGITEVGVYFAKNWWPNDTADELAERVSALCNPLFANTAPDFPAVCADIETNDVDFQLAFFTTWRHLRPRRITDLTIEGHKGGLYRPADVIRIVAATRYIGPQSYNGANTQVWDSLAMARDLVDAGFPIATVYPFLDAAHLGEWWQGYAFTQGRLP